MRTQKIATACELANFPESECNNRLDSSASSMPGSSRMKYIPIEPSLHKYTVNPNCIDLFRPKLVWKSEPRITSDYRRIQNKLGTLPMISPSSVRYMAASEAYFFDIYLEGEVKITISQYIDEFEEGAYVNVWLHGEVAFQGKMTIDEIVASVNDFYSGENG